MTDDYEEVEVVSRLFSGIAHRNRVVMLLGIREGRSMQDVADDLGVTRGGLQDHVERMIEAELIYRPEEGSRTYDLTPFGAYLADLIDADSTMLQEAFALLEQYEAAVEEEFAAADLPITDRTKEKTIHTQKWERAWEDVENRLQE